MISRYPTGRLAKHSPGYDEVFVTITVDDEGPEENGDEVDVLLRVTGRYSETTGGVHPSGEVERLDDTEIDEVSVKVENRWMQFDQGYLSDYDCDAIREALQESGRPE